MIFDVFIVLFGFNISFHEIEMKHPNYLSESPLGSSKDVQPVSQANHEAAKLLEQACEKASKPEWRACSRIEAI